MNNFLVRLATGLVVAALFIAATLYSWLTYGVVVLIAVAGGVYEFYSISAPARHGNTKGRALTVTLAVVVTLFSVLFNKRPFIFADIAVLLPAVLFFFFVRELFTKSDNPFQEIGWSILPFIYVVLPVMLLNWLYFDKGPLFALSILFLIWFYDSMCYICGSLFGRTKLIERISPKKTVEGLVGGMVLSLIFVFFFDKIFAYLGAQFHMQLPLDTYTNINWLIIGAVTLVFATFGDLVESLLKRSLNIKDSGSIMPGHGGFLDRLDAILVALPFAVLVIWFTDRIGEIRLLIDFLS
ncbi:MAG: phosphatidate cytidylyltransferase [Bacteroidetes bacterium]|nr:phosphatidate cytidylyltransferase [Bacteroidota bacterium]